MCGMTVESSATGRRERHAAADAWQCTRHRSRHKSCCIPVQHPSVCLLGLMLLLLAGLGHGAIRQAALLSWTHMMP